MKFINNQIYSKEPFDEYLFRAKVKFVTKEIHAHFIDIYTTEPNRSVVEKALREIKSEKVLFLDIINWSSREQDDNTTKFIDEFLNTL